MDPPLKRQLIPYLLPFPVASIKFPASPDPIHEEIVLLSITVWEKVAKTPLGNTEKRGFYACGSPVAPVGGKPGTQFDAYSILLWLITIHPIFVVHTHIIPSDGGGQHVMLQHGVAVKPPLCRASTAQAWKLEHVGLPTPART